MIGNKTGCRCHLELRSYRHERCETGGALWAAGLLVSFLNPEFVS